MSVKLKVSQPRSKAWFATWEGKDGRKGREKGDDEKNPISRFDPKAKAATDAGRSTGERIEGAAQEEKKKRCLLARTLNIGCYVNCIPLKNSHTNLSLRQLIIWQIAK